MSRGTCVLDLGITGFKNKNLVAQVHRKYPLVANGCPEIEAGPFFGNACVAQWIARLAGVIDMTFLKNFIADESGASAAEYALILAVVGAAIGIGTFALSGQISRAITGATTEVTDSNTNAGW